MYDDEEILPLRRGVKGFWCEYDGEAWKVYDAKDRLINVYADFDIEEMIDALESLNNGWDGGTSKSIDQQTIRQAKNYLGFFYSISQLLSLAWSNPYIVPVPRGTIQFEWHLDPRYLEIEINSDGLCSIFYEDSSKEVEEEFHNITMQFAGNFVLRVLVSVYSDIVSLEGDSTSSKPIREFIVEIDAILNKKMKISNIIKKQKGSY